MPDLSDTPACAPPSPASVPAAEVGGDDGVRLVGTPEVLERIRRLAGAAAENETLRIEVASLKAKRDAALAGRAALLELLREVEWSQKTTRLKNGGTIYTATTCPICGGEKDPPRSVSRGASNREPPPMPPYAPADPGGHAPKCHLAAALAPSE